MISIDIDPVAKPRMTRRDTWAKRPCVVKYYQYKDALVKATRKKKFHLGDKYKVEFLIKMPDSWSDKRKKMMLGKPHQQKPDLDNLLKAINDCLVKSDQTIWYIESSKIWWDSGKILFYEI